MSFLRSFGRHTTLIVLVVWSVLPFTWAIQSSIKFTRDVARKEPVLWGYETTSSAYNKFWLDDDEINMYKVLAFILAFAGAALILAMMGRRVSRGSNLLFGIADFVRFVVIAVIGIAVAVAAVLLIVQLIRWRWLGLALAVPIIAVIAALCWRFPPRSTLEATDTYGSGRAWPFFVAVPIVLGFGMWLFPRIFEVEDEYSFFVNSIIVTVLTMLISISIGLLAGYALARYSGISGAVILIIALAFRALPRTAFVLPYYFAAQKLGILDSRLVIVMALVAVNQPFTIWMFRTFFMDVPKEMEEAAMMDGATRFEAFRKVIIPIMWPGIIATSLFTLLLAYNEYLFVRVLAPTNWTLPVAIVSLTGGESSRTITEAAAASVSITLPIIIVIILFQKHLVKGLGAGAVKG